MDSCKMIFRSKHKVSFFFASIIFAMVTFLNSCNQDIFSTSPKHILKFSIDTLTFDTVFTTIGSATSKIMVYNRGNQALNISSLSVAGGSSSPFQINVDGSLNKDNKFTNVEIRANDSMYIFVQVTIDPNRTNAPLFIEDSLMFIKNGVYQNVKLQAVGQNVMILKNKIITNDTTLSAEKPYLIYGDLVVDTAKTLTLTPGCKFYFHNNANLIVYGNLHAEGTFENPILMRGDRLDKIKFATPFPYNNVAGQWGGVYLLWNGGNHILRHVKMNSGYVGVYFSNNDFSRLPDLEISDCKIHNFLMYGLVVQNGNVQVSNSEISNTSSYCVFLNGGKHSFLQSTIVNYFSNSDVQPVSRDNKPAVMIMNLNRTAPMQSVFRNCVIAGSNVNEFSLASRYLNQFRGVFDHCYIQKTDSMNLPQFTSIRWSQKNDSIFKSIRYDYKNNTYFNFMPDSISPIRGIADPNIARQFPVDLNGNNRMTDNKPDLGAYQWQPTH